jgi:hypothetical protein
MNARYHQIMDWFCTNCLESNDRKSLVVNFTKPNTPTLIQRGSICCGESTLEIVDEAKFLGVWLDSHLSGGSHIQKLKRKLLGGMAALLKTRHLLDVDSLRLIYHAFFTSNLVFGVEFFGMTYSNKIDPIYILQKRALRLIAGLTYNESLRDYWTKYNILPFPFLIEYSICLYIYKSIHGFYPNVLELGRCAKLTRGSCNNKLILSGSSSEAARHSIGNLGLVIWNSLPNSITSLSCSVDTFKKHLKNEMMRRAMAKYYPEED